MGTKMTHTARAELTNVVRRRYCAASGAEKRKILDEFIAVTGNHHKSALRALNAGPIAKRPQIRVRPSLYDEAVRAALIVLWEASDRVCGKRLRALLPILLPAFERNGHLHLDEPMRQKILAMSGGMSASTDCCECHVARRMSRRNGARSKTDLISTLSGLHNAAAHQG